MKKVLWHFGIIATALLMVQCSPSKSEKKSGEKIRVGVFDGHGGAETCIWESVAAVRLDPDMEVYLFTTSDMASGVLDSFDAIIVPGGGGSRQYLNMGGKNRERLLRFVEEGGGAVGICAGAYLFSDTPEYACLGINGLQAIDIEHDNRGHGVAKFTLTEEGKQWFPEIAERDTSYVVYYEGPVFVPNPTSKIGSTTLAIMESDVHEEGNAPSNMTNGRPFFAINEYGLGKVVSSIAHPEATPGMMWIIPRLVRLSLGMAPKPYRKEVVQPDICNREILMSVEMLGRERECFRTLLYGTAAEKVSALDWLQTHQSWDAKRWVQGTLFDSDPEVRLRAAKYISETQYLHYLPDLERAAATESDRGVKKWMSEYLHALRALLPTE